MKSFQLVLAVVAAVGPLAMGPHNVFAQTLTYSATPLVAAAAPVCQSVDEAAQVQAALSQFDSALASRDIQQLQAAGIKPESAKGWQKFFKNNPGAKVTDKCPAGALGISGDTAIWSCTETATLISEGKPLAYAQPVRFMFARKDGVWSISDRR